MMAVGAIFASLAYGQNNTAEQTWLERIIQEMYDIVQQTPLYQSWTRKALEEGRKEGLEKGKVEGMRQTLVSIVRVRFPRLVSLAKTQVAQINDPGALDDLIVKISTASKAQEARRFLLGEEDGQ